MRLYPVLISSVKNYFGSYGGFFVFRRGIGGSTLVIMPIL